MSNYRSADKVSGWGAWLKSQIQARGMTQNEFALAVGVSKSTASRWMADDQPKSKYVDAIADVLVLDYDLVAVKSGNRPAIHDVPPDSREARVAHLVTRIDWENPGAAAVVSMLETLAHQMPKRREETATE